MEEGDLPNVKFQALFGLEEHLTAHLIFGTKDAVGPQGHGEEGLAIIGLEHLLLLEDLGLDVHVDRILGIGGSLVRVLQILAFIDHTAAAGEHEALKKKTKKRSQMDVLRQEGFFPTLTFMLLQIWITFLVPLTFTL